MPKKDKCIIKKLEVEVVRVKITLACTECKQRNYSRALRGEKESSGKTGNQQVLQILQEAYCS